MGKNIVCPICGHMEKQLYLDETDGWFICSKCSSEVKIEYSAGISHIHIKKKGKVTDVPVKCPKCNANQTLTEEETEKGICKCYNCGVEFPVVITEGVALSVDDSLSN